MLCFFDCLKGSILVTLLMAGLSCSSTPNNTNNSENTDSATDDKKNPTSSVTDPDNSKEKSDTKEKDITDIQKKTKEVCPGYIVPVAALYPGAVVNCNDRTIDYSGIDQTKCQTDPTCPAKCSSPTTCTVHVVGCTDSQCNVTPQDTGVPTITCSKVDNCIFEKIPPPVVETPKKYGAVHSCYGIDDDAGEAYVVNIKNDGTLASRATYSCKVVNDQNGVPVSEIDGISVHPVTGIYYYVTQDPASFGTFSPDVCTFNRIATVTLEGTNGQPYTDTIAGFSFHPDTAKLFATSEGGYLYEFTNVNGAFTGAIKEIGPIAGEGLALTIPQNNIKNVAYYSSGGSSIIEISLTDASRISEIPLGQYVSVEALMFNQEGKMIGVMEEGGNPANSLLMIDVANNNLVTYLGMLNTPLCPAGQICPPDIADMESVDCTATGACDNCENP